MSTSDISLKYWALNTPPAIDALATELGYEDIGFVSPSFYRSTSPKHHFDLDKANRNLVEITTALDGQDIMVTDLEKDPRRIIRDPDDYEIDEINWALNQYLSMWKWFRTNFPDLKLSEWGFHKGEYEGDQPLAEHLMLTHTDTIDCSAYWKTNANWHTSRENYISRAVELGQKHSKPVTLWLWERHTTKMENHSIKISEPLTETAMEDMISMAVRGGIDSIVVWSNSFLVLDNNKPSYVMAETLGQAPDHDARPLVSAQMALLLSRLRLAVSG